MFGSKSKQNAQLRVDGALLAEAALNKRGGQVAEAAQGWDDTEAARRVVAEFAGDVATLRAQLAAAAKGGRR